MRRSAHGLPPLKSIADITATDEPDVILAQAVDIMADDAVTLEPSDVRRSRWRARRTTPRADADAPQ